MIQKNMASGMAFKFGSKTWLFKRKCDIAETELDLEIEYVFLGPCFTPHVL
jgi:hypothetical protein